MSTEWYYVKAGQRYGPISREQLDELAGGGQIGPQDMVWKEGMSEWIGAGKVEGLFGASAGQYATPQEIGYYNPVGSLPARTAVILRGMATPTGPQGDWPLSDEHLAQLQLAESHRKQIRNLVSLFNLGLLIFCILAPIYMLVGLFSLGSGGRRGSEDAMMGLVGFLITGALATLCFFSGRHTRLCRIWPSIVATVLLGVFILGLFVSIFIMSTARRGGFGPRPDIIVAPIIASILPGAFIYVSIRAMLAIPRFLATPVWCQEALINAKL
jgi:hypothetical protein